MRGAGRRGKRGGEGLCETREERGELVWLGDPKVTVWGWDRLWYMWRGGKGRTLVRARCIEVSQGAHHSVNE